MNLYLLLPLLAFLCNLALLPWVIWGKRHSRLHLTFALFLGSMALWGLTIYLMRSSPTLAEAFVWEQVVIVVIPLAVVLFLHFTLLFSRRAAGTLILVGAYGLLLLFAGLVPLGLVAVGMQRRFYGYAPVLGPLFLPYLFYVYLGLALALANLIHVYRKAISSQERTRASYLIAGTVCSVVGGTTDYLPVLGLPLYPLGIVGNLLFTLLATVAIAKHQLLDIHFALRRGVFYSLLSALAVGLYVAVVVILNRLFQGVAGLPFVLDLAAILVVAMLLQPLLRGMQNRVDRWFYRERYDALKALERFSLENRDLVDLEPLAHALVSQVQRAMQAEFVVLLLPAPQHPDLFTVSGWAGTPEPPLIALGRPNPLLLWLERRGIVMGVQELDLLPQWQALLAEEKEALENLGGELFVPLLMQRRLSGLLILGPKRGRSFFGQEDVNLLQTVAHQAATGLERVRLYAAAQAHAREARRLEQRYRRLVHHANDSILLLDPEGGQILEANQQSLALFGYSSLKLLTMRIADLVAPADQERLARLLQALVAGREVRLSELHLVRRDSSLLPVEISASLVAAEEERLILVIVRDISERVRAQEEFQRAHERVVEAKTNLEQALEQLRATQEQLLHSEKMAALGRLVSGVAHELNNPLTGVLGYAQLLTSQKDLPHEMRRDLDRIAQEAQRAARIVQNLLSFARRQRPEKRLLDVREVLERVLELRAYDLRVNNITLITDLPPDLPRIMADPYQLQQVFLNIITNAEQAMLEAHHRGTLLIRASPPEAGLVRLSFADDGPGIPAEDLNRIFDPFFTTKPVGQGTGLGLSICYGIVEEHGGRIAVQSEQGQGATFVVELPVGAAAPPAPEEALAQGQPVASVRGHILVIDDEPTVEDLLRRVLQEEGHLVEGARSGEEALRRLAKASYDLVITDLKMPGLSGFQLYEEIAAAFPGLAQRMIFVTGDTVREETYQGLERIGCPCLSKPFDASRLKATVRQILEGC